MLLTAVLIVVTSAINMYICHNSRERIEQQLLVTNKSLNESLDECRQKLLGCHLAHKQVLYEIREIKHINSAVSLLRTPPSPYVTVRKVNVSEESPLPPPPILTPLSSSSDVL